MLNRWFWCGLLMASLGLGCLSPSPVEAPPEPIDNRRPIAVSSPGSDYPIGSTVTLSGLDSFDPDGDPLLYHWSADIPGMPDVEGEGEEFSLDLQTEGPYLIVLTVEDPFGATSSTSVRVRAFIPVPEIEVNAGPVELFRQVVVQGSIELNGTVEANVSWRLRRSPPQSTAQLADTDTLEPSFLADRVGQYVIELRVDSPWSTYKSEISVIAMASQFEPHGRYVGFDYSPVSGKFASTISSSNTQELQILDPSNWSAIDISFPRPQHVSFTSDGTQLVLGYGTSATPRSIAQIDSSSGSILNSIPVTSPQTFHTALDDQIVFSNSNRATTLNLQSQVENSISGILGSRLLSATNTGNKFYAWHYNTPGRIGRLTVTGNGPIFLGSHQLAADDCNPLWSSPSEQFVISSCGKILRVSDDEALDLSEIGDLSVTSIEAAVHATNLGLIIVATAENDEFALRAFNDITFDEEWVRALPYWYAAQSSAPLRVLTPLALYMLPDGQTLLVAGQTSPSFGQHYLLRFKL